MTDDLTRPEVLRLLLKRMSATSTAEPVVVKDENNCLVKAHLRRERKILEEFYRRNGDDRQDLRQLYVLGETGRN